MLIESIELHEALNKLALALQGRIADILLIQQFRRTLNDIEARTAARKAKDEKC